MDKNTPIIMWFRQDLRLNDNPALTAAVKTGKPLICLYIDDQETFALAVQWHPEWNAKFDPISKKLFEAFSYAIKKRKKR